MGYTIALLLLVTVGLDAGFVLEHPEELIFPFALIIAMAILGGAALQSEREHRRVAVIDPLTGLLNRSAFAQRLGELQHQIDRGVESSLGFLIADIDHFKRINDEHGHPVGDAVLRDVAYAMRSELRAFDLIYRLGGEEFAILLPGADLDKTREIAERLRAASPLRSTGGISVTMSFGAARSAAAPAPRASCTRRPTPRSTRRSAVGATAWVPGRAASGLTARAGRERAMHRRRAGSRRIEIPRPVDPIASPHPAAVCPGTLDD